MMMLVQRVSSLQEVCILYFGCVLLAISSEIICKGSMNQDGGLLQESVISSLWDVSLTKASKDKKSIHSNPQPFFTDTQSSVQKQNSTKGIGSSPVHYTLFWRKKISQDLRISHSCPKLDSNCLFVLYQCFCRGDDVISIRGWCDLPPR